MQTFLRHIANFSLRVMHSNAWKFAHKASLYRYNPELGDVVVGRVTEVWQLQVILCTRQHTLP